MTDDDLAPRRTADHLDSALVRLARTLEGIDDLALESRVLGSSRRDVAVAVLIHLDRVVATLHARRRRDGRPRVDPADARDVGCGDGAALGAATGLRRQRLAEALEQAIERLGDRGGAWECDLVDELDALLARVELGHVSLDAGYDLADLPPASLAACERVSEAHDALRSTPPGAPRIRPTARRRPGIASPPGRRSQ